MKALLWVRNAVFAVAMFAAIFAATLVAVLATVATLPKGNVGTVQVSA